MSLFRQVCGTAGVKATHQRLEILREIACAQDHPTVEAVCDRVRKRIPSISLDTVYRTLAMFGQHGVVQKLQILEEPVRYDGKRTRQHHFICKACKAIVDFEWPDFDGLRLPAAALRCGKVASRQAQVYGLCKECLQGRA